MKEHHLLDCSLDKTRCERNDEREQLEEEARIAMDG